ncbi:MAG TPA: GAF domain-containing protein [Bryobacteraceae bacterium]|jgi:C4-dicarboxylate-specific signal transduction histidine kinase|nr:GAF domain-containing protein [Bryobacteraceae bacterium]
MASIANAAILDRRFTPLLLLAGLLWAAGGLCGQTRLSLEEAATRRMPDYAPAHLGEMVQVQGRISSKPAHFLFYSHLVIQEGEHGLTLEGTPPQYAAIRPGDDLRVVGRVGVRGGLPVVRPSDIQVIGHGPPPAPRLLPPGDLQGDRYLGQLVVTEGRVGEVGETTGGAYLLIGNPKNLYKIFVPFSPGHTTFSLGEYSVGDTVRATGFASQYCAVPPYNRWFEMVVASPADVVRIDRSMPVSPIALAAIGAVLVLMGFIWWSREQRLRTQREVLRRAYQLGEEILGAPSEADILKRTSLVLPEIFGVNGSRLYLHNRANKTLEVPELRQTEERISIPLAAPPNGTQAGAVACFHYRTLLSIPDAAHSPFPLTSQDGSKPPKSLLFVPMFAQGEIIGVMELDQSDRIRDFSPDERALAQHLGNQIGVAIRLLEQRSVREQLFRTEKLAAVGRLLSGVVEELQAPLVSISRFADAALADRGRARASLQALSVETRRAGDIVARLVSFAGSEQAQAKPLDVNQILRNLIEFREREWKTRGIRVRDLTAQEPLLVLGSQGQLEQVFLNLLVYAEQALTEASEKSIVVRSSLLAKRILVEITYSGPPEVPDPFAGGSDDSIAPGLGVCSSIVAGHGGEVRLVQVAGADPRFEIELPWSPRERSAPRSGDSETVTPQYPATVLLMEADPAGERHLSGLLTARGCRVVPVQNTDLGLDLAQRLHFDIAVCSVHAPGLNWVELSERMQSLVGCFVLLSEAYDAELIENFEGENRFVISKPVEDQQLDRVFQAWESSRPHGVSTH